MLSSGVRKTLCSALVQPYFDYCISSWYSGVTADCKKKLDVLQRKMIRFIFCMDNRTHVDTSHLKSLGWLSVPDRVAYFKLIHVFRIFGQTAPRYLTENFKRVKDSHNHDTRGSSTDFYVPKIGQTNVLYNSFFFTSILSWNSLPMEVK